MREMIVAVVPVFCVLIGAILQHTLAKAKERDGQFTNLRNQAYADYLRSVSAVAMDRSTEAVTQLTDAKARMAIYASDEVMRLLAAVEETGAVLTYAPSMTAFVNLAAQMRKESGGSGGSEHLAAVLFGSRPTKLRPAA